MNEYIDFNKLLSLGVILLSACILGTCISSTSIYYENWILNTNVLLVPYSISYIFIFIGIISNVYKMKNYIKNK